MSFKRVFDLLAASAALVVASPVLAVVAVLTKLSSPGPVFHRATRIGRSGTPFTVLKFRTMRVESDDGSGITAANNARITRVGAILRRFKVDELPQMFNVLRGDMSIVGPRPEDPRYVAGYSEEQRRVLSVRPGITSPAAIAFRDEERLIASLGGDVGAVYREKILPAKLALDMEYIERQTFWFDLAVIVKTAVGLLTSPKREPA